MDKFYIDLEIIHYNIVVRGKVHGVWFRKYTKDKADELGIMGFVKNDLEKTVYIEAEGSVEVLSKFVEWLYKGSPLSKVSEVAFEIMGLQNYMKFEIRC